MTNSTLHTALYETPPVDFRLNTPPLVSVVLQVVFPPVLKIENRDALANFQDKIRSVYPEIEQQEGRDIQIEISPEGKAETREEKSITWTFSDEEKKWKATLSTKSISLTTNSYKTRTDFLDRFDLVLNAVEQIFAPSHTKRIGLRYVNQFKGEQFKKINQFINPELIGVMSRNSEDVIHMLTEAALKAKEGTIMARWGKLPANGTMDPTLLPPSNEDSWVIDVDMFSQERFLFKDDCLEKQIRSMAERQFAVFSWMTTEVLRVPMVIK